MSMAVMSQVTPKILGDNDAGLKSDSAKAVQLIDERFEFGVEDTEQLVFTHTSYDADASAYRAVVEGLAEDLRALPEVASVVTYYDTGDRDGMVADEGRVQRAEIIVAGSSAIAGPGSDLYYGDRVNPITETVFTAREEAEAAGFTIDIAGELSINTEIDKMAEEDLGRVLIISLGLGLIFMLLVFRAVVAAVIPLTLAIGAMIIANGIAAVVSQSYALNESYGEMITLLGLAVGIDYSLFIVSRFRSERKAGVAKLDAITVASNTTGRAVFYAGITVLLSLSGLALTNNAIFISLALGAILVVTIAIVGSLTTLPAVLAILGDNINRLQIPFLSRANGDGVWSRIVTRVMARPAIFAGVTAATLIVVALPILSLDLGFNSGSAALHEDMETKQAVVLLEEHFTGGLAAPAFLVVDAPDVTTPEVEASVAQIVEAVDQNEAFYPAADAVRSSAGDALFIAIPLAGNKDANETAVDLLRNEIVPEAFARHRRTRTRHRKHRIQHGLHGPDERIYPLRIRLHSRAGLPAPAGHVPLDSDPGKGDPPEPALGRGRLRGRGDGVPVGLGRGIPWLRGRGDRRMAAAFPLRHPVRPVHGLPHAPAEPHQGRARQRTLDR
jgi:RND superfamily putative drug exporter